MFLPSHVMFRYLPQGLNVTARPQPSVRLSEVRARRTWQADSTFDTSMTRQRQTAGPVVQGCRRACATHDRTVTSVILCILCHCGSVSRHATPRHVAHSDYLDDHRYSVKYPISRHAQYRGLLSIEACPVSRHAQYRGMPSIEACPVSSASGVCGVHQVFEVS